MGNPSFSFSMRTFFRATFFPVCLCLALNTSPKVPWPIFASFSYFENSSQKGNSTPS
uniref:Uncharacterized protein n=1 Tax=Anguilla anguilla TaxID=7936 RepID=A0A0E9TZ64_ANGAN